MASLYSRKRKNSKGIEKKLYVVQYKDPVKGRQYKYFNLRREAADYLSSVTEYEKDGFVLLPDTTEEVIEKWLEACRVGRDGAYPLEPETIKIYKSLSSNHILPYFKGQVWSEIDKNACKKFRDHLVKNTNSRSTAKSILTAFKICMSYSLEEGIIISNPSDGVTIAVGGRHKKDKVVIPSRAEIRSISQTLNHLTETRPDMWKRYAPMIFIKIYCGLRISELLGLPRENINIKNTSITVTQKSDKSGVIGPPKTQNAYRTVYFPKMIGPLITDFLKTHNHQLAFPTKTGKPMLQSNFRKRVWKPLLRAAEANESYTVHSLRHFYASVMIANGCNVKELCKSMGHHDEGFTLRTYGHLFEDEESIRHRKQMANAIVI